MSIGSHSHDHQLKIGSTTRELDIMRDENGQAMYAIEEQVPDYKDPFLIKQKSWVGGHGQYEFIKDDVYYEGQSIDTTEDGKVFLGPLITEVKESDDTDLDSAPVCFQWFGTTGEWLCATAGKIYRYNVGANLKWTAATTAVTGVVNLTEYNGVMYAARGAATAYSYSTDGDTWTATDLTDAYAVKFLNSPNADGTANVLWKYKTPNELTYTTNGKTVAAGGVQWSSPAYIGDTSGNITNNFLTAKKLLIGRTDALFHYDSDGGTHNLMPELATSKSTRNFQYVADWQVATYFSLMESLGEIYAGNTYDTMGPLTKIDDIGKSGSCVGITSDDNWLFVAEDEGTNTVIYKCREIRRPDKDLRWEYCPWIFLSTNACATIKVCQHSAIDRRLWFGYGVNTGYVTLTENPLSDSTARFCLTGWVRMSYEYGSNPYWDKMIQSIVTETSACTANLTVQPKYRKDTETSATNLTGAIITNGVVKTNLTTALTCNRIQFELHLATNASTATPIVSLFEARGVEKPETIRTHDVTYHAGSKPGVKGSTIRDFLRGARTSTSLVKFADLRYGQTTESGTKYYWIIMEPGYPKEVEILSGKTKQPEAGLRCRMKEVAYTIS